MNTLNNRRPSSRLVLPNGPLALRLSVEAGWNAEDLAAQTDATVERLARDKDPCTAARYRRRIAKRKALRQCVGLGGETIAKIMAGKPIFLTSLVIFAKTVGVDHSTLIVD